MEVLQCLIPGPWSSTYAATLTSYCSDEEHSETRFRDPPDSSRAPDVAYLLSLVDFSSVSIIVDMF
jgi:hypothetical protein